MSESTMICETAWGEAPGRVVFKGHGDWPVYVPERTCELDWVGRIHAFVCSECRQMVMMPPSSNPSFCPRCGARVERDA